MPRPTHATVLEAIENEHGNLEVWVDFDGTIAHFAFVKWQQCLEHRKLVYGFAHLEVNGRLDETQQAEADVVDNSPDALQLAFAAELALALDRWEEHEVPIGGHDGDAPAPPRPSVSPRTHKKAAVIPRPEWHGTHVIPAKCPDVQPVPVINRKAIIEALATSIPVKKEGP